MTHLFGSSFKLTVECRYTSFRFKLLFMCCLVFINQSDHILTLLQTRFQPLLSTMFHPGGRNRVRMILRGPLWLRMLSLWFYVSQLSVQQHYPALFSDKWSIQKFSDDSAVVGCIRRVRRLSTGLWWITLSHGVSWTTCSSTQQRPKSLWWIWGEPGHQWSQFPSWGTTWTLLNTTSIWVCSSTINWTGLSTLKSSTRRDRAASIFWGGSAPLTCRIMLRMFYESVVASAILFAVVCWDSRLRVAHASRLNKLIRKASDILVVELDTLSTVSDRRMLSKVQAILQYGFHPLHNALVGQRSTFRDWLLPNAPLSTTGSHSYLWSLNCTTPTSDYWTHMAIYKTKQI